MLAGACARFIGDRPSACRRSREDAGIPRHGVGDLRVAWHAPRDGTSHRRAELTSTRDVARLPMRTNRDTIAGPGIASE